MSLLVTTQSYSFGVPTEYGLLLELDKDTGSVVRMKRINTPAPTPKNLQGRIKPGLRGIDIYNNQIYVATWNTVHVLDIDTHQEIHSFSHKWMADLHGIYIAPSGIWVSSALPDAVINYDFNGKPQAALWIPETSLYKNRATVNKDMDWRHKGKDFRNFHEFHANNVAVHGDSVYVTGRSCNNGRVVRFGKDEFLSKGTVKNNDIEVFSSHLYGPHDGLWREDGFFITETMGSTVAKIDKRGKIACRIKVKTDGSEADPRKINALKKIRKVVGNLIKGRPTLDKTSHWTRGLAVTKNHIFVGQSTWAGTTGSRARIVKIDRHSHDILDTFYLDIDEYPETRIYQVLDVQTGLK